MPKLPVVSGQEAVKALTCLEFIAAAGTLWGGNTLLDVFEYAKNWTEWGMGWWIFGVSHPERFDPDNKAAGITV